MSKLYASKFKLLISYDKDNNADQTLPEGTIFTVDYVDFGMIVLKPVAKCAVDSYRVDPLMLNYAFTEN